MAETKKPRVGTVGWIDLSVANHEETRTFYESVVGWKSSPVDMGEYQDFNMHQPDDNQVVAGICSEKSATVPGGSPQWMIYFTVDNVDERAAACEEHGGKLLWGPKDMGSYGRFAVVEDPSGARVTIYSPGDES